MSLTSPFPQESAVVEAPPPKQEPQPEVINPPPFVR